MLCSLCSKLILAMIEYYGTSTFVGSGRLNKELSKGLVIRFKKDDLLHEVYVWQNRDAIAHDEDEAPVVLRIQGEPVAEYGSLEEFLADYPELNQFIYIPS